MAYIDGFVLAVPAAKKQAYLESAKKFSAIFKEFGALTVVEAWGDDVPEGKLTSFTMAVQRADDETVVFSWITWPSKETRDAGWVKAMADPRMPNDPGAMPFDGKRMIFGGFTPIVDV